MQSGARFHVLSEGRAEIEVKGSRFRACALPSPTLAEAKRSIRRLEHAERRATHVCWALFTRGDSGEEVARSHDAGEPSGTAGRPIRAAIDELHATGVLVVVARVFGGVKLGAGGLKRAYHRAALEALRTCRLDG